MADFRKLLLALIAGALLFTTAASAIQPYSCTAVPTQTLVRQEALADYTGDIVLSCSGTVDNPAVGLVVNIRLTMNNNVNITSNPLNSATPPVTEATMILNEGLGASGRSYEGYSTAISVPQPDGSQNVYQARQVPGMPTAVEWEGVVIAGPNSNPVQIIRLTNIRVNASGLAVNTAISGNINITTPTSFPIANSNGLIVANVAQPMVFAVNAQSISTCGAASTVTRDLTMTFKEGYSYGFKARGNPIVNNYIPGGNYPNESGFSPGDGTSTYYLAAGSLIGFTGYSGGPPVVNTASTIGYANQGTQLTVRIKSVPAGVTVTPISATDDIGGLGVTLQSSSPVTLDGSGNGTILYEVTSLTGASLSLVDTVTITLRFSYAAPVPAPNGIVKVNGSYAPISTVGTASLLDPEPRFIDSNLGDSTAFTFAGVCNTLLLFPYLANPPGTTFDTGIAIMNTTKDPLGTAPQNGACTMYWYGNIGARAMVAADTNFVPPTAGVSISPVVPSGGYLVGTLSAGAGWVWTNAGVSTACAGCVPIGFQGYMIANCNFQYAHGYAFVTKIGAVDLAQGYLALVIPSRGNVTPARPPDPFSTAGSATGEQLTP